MVQLEHSAPGADVNYLPELFYTLWLVWRRSGLFLTIFDDANTFSIHLVFHGSNDAKSFGVGFQFGRPLGLAVVV
jgi:hypothetical protein